MKKNLFFVFCFSFIPGAAQMYQGYMKRGVSLMSLFAIFVILVGVISTPIFAVPLPIIFAYSFFDTYHIRQRILEGKTLEDEYIWKGTELEQLTASFSKYKRNRFVGMILIIVGMYLFLNSVLIPLTYRFDLDILYTVLRVITNYIPSIVIASISIAVGIKLVSKK